MMKKKITRAVIAAIGAAALLAATPMAAGAAPPWERVADVQPATPGTLEQCDGLVEFSYESTQIDHVELVPAGGLTNAGADVGEHCLVQGRMNERVSEADGQTYAIGFEMRLPADWAGRYLYQANGGLDGAVNTAVGSFTGGQLENGLQQGFAVISSDAGHTGDQTPLFGLDPQARLDYGYQAVGTLTPMAKSLIEQAYGRGPDTSYIAGGSNGGRHTMVASTRYADDYDGFYAIAPGFNLPKTGVSQLWTAQQWASIADSPDDLRSAVTAEELQVIADAVLERCDGIDRLRDGVVSDSERCQKFFDVQRDVPTCDDDRDGTCLTQEQKDVVERIFAGGTTSDGDEIYSPWPYDPGITNGDWALWSQQLSSVLGSMAYGFVFAAEPADPSIMGDLPGFALSTDIDEAAESIRTAGSTGESSMSFMTPPDPTNLDELQENGGKMLIVHGASDSAFSADDTARWYSDVDKRYKKADSFARYFQVPGMGHVSGGAATDQFDGLGAIVTWVEHGEAPDELVAAARGEGNPGGVNPEVPADWADDRTRLLCPYPEVARYVGGDPEVASSFACKPSSGGPNSAGG